MRGIFAAPARIAMICAILACAPLGCTPQFHWQKAARHLDYVARYVDEWGTVTASEPLVRPDNGGFAMTYDRTAKEYIDAARTGNQAAAARSFQQALDVQTATRVDADIQKLAAAAATSGAAAALPDASAEADTPAPDPMLPLDRPARGVLSSAQFSAPLGIGTLPAQISERQALIIGLNDKISENLLKYLVHPVDLPKGRSVYLAALTISVNPGWRTRRGYVADVNVAMNYARETDNAWESSRRLKGKVQPFTVSVFPSVEAQTADLRNSIREQIALASFLAATLRANGATAQAEQLADFAQRSEFDIATRNPIPVLSAYSNGSTFGYQIRPSLQALADPADDESGTDSVLHPASFPALMLFVIDDDERKGRDGKGDWLGLEFMINARWVPVDRCAARPSEGERIEIAKRLDAALDEIWWAATPTEEKGLVAKPAEIAQDSATGQELIRRYNLYLSAGQGITRYSRHFDAVKPKDAAKDPAGLTIKDVIPDVGWQNAPTALLIEGTGFSAGGASLVKEVLVGGVVCTVVPIGDTSLVAIVPDGAFRGIATAQDVIVVRKDAKQVRSSAVRFTRTRAAAPRAGTPAVSLTRDAGGRVTGIVVNGDGAVPPATLINAIQRVLEKEHGHDKRVKTFQQISERQE